MKVFRVTVEIRDNYFAVTSQCKQLSHSLEWQVTKTSRVANSKWKLHVSISLPVKARL